MQLAIEEGDRHMYMYIHMYVYKEVSILAFSSCFRFGVDRRRY